MSGRAVIVRTGLPSLAFILSACGAAPPATQAGGAVCDGAELLVVNCSGCHDGSSSTTGFLDLRHPDAQIGDLVGKPASGPACAGTGAVLVESGGRGLLLDKLSEAPPCGDRMPQGTFPFSMEEIACVQQWVAARVPAS